MKRRVTRPITSGKLKKKMVDSLRLSSCIVVCNLPTGVEGKVAQEWIRHVILTPIFWFHPLKQNCLLFFSLLFVTIQNDDSNPRVSCKSSVLPRLNLELWREQKSGAFVPSSAPFPVPFPARPVEVSGPVSQHIGRPPTFDRDFGKVSQPTSFSFLHL